MTATFTRPSITIELAEAMIAAAEKKSADIGEAATIAIVDDSGVLKAFSRMDRAPLMSVQSAQDKAHTAVGFDLSTEPWEHDRARQDAAYAIGVASSQGLTLFGGAHPVMIGDAIVGAIGIGGCSSPAQNEEVAQAALSAVSS